MSVVVATTLSMTSAFILVLGISSVCGWSKTFNQVRMVQLGSHCTRIATIDNPQFKTFKLSVAGEEITVDYGFFDEFPPWWKGEAAEKPPVAVKRKMDSSGHDTEESPMKR